MLVLVACEFSGTVREAFAAQGADAWSCDLLPTTRRGNGQHIVADVREVIRERPWDLLIAHPPCTYLASSGLHRNGRTRSRFLTHQALAFVRELLAAPVPRIALENPVGCISTRLRPHDQAIQPYEFGHDASKKTCLWLKGLPPLRKNRAQRVPGRLVEWPPGSRKLVERWSNQTDSGQNRLSPSEKRWAERSVTYRGIAEAMASQWIEVIQLQAAA